jgi:hypothetical protein
MIPTYWADGQDDYRTDVMMSSMPSRDEVIDALRKADELSGYSADYIDNLRVERPDGWYYKKILIYNSSSPKPEWKFEPAP